LRRAKRTLAEIQHFELLVFQGFRRVRRAIHRFPSANSVMIWAVFFIKPRYRVFV
jgi:hypothetical protein